jgi:membrane associated rhomboid family serine protease
MTIELGLFFLGLSHAIFGMLAYGMSFAYLQKEYPEKCDKEYIRDVAFCVFFGLCGLGGLLGVYFASERGKHGLKFK